MACIRINGQHSWVVAGWVFRYVLDRMEFSQLPKVLAQRVTESRDPYLNYLDLGDLAPQDRELFSFQVSRIAGDLIQAGPSSIAEPSFYAGLVDRIIDLRSLLEASLAVSQQV